MIDALSGHESVDVHHVGWLVDDDNPAWAELRAEAVAAAIAQARDYAAALGAEVAAVEEVADVGLLSESSKRAGPVAFRAQAAGRPSEYRGGGLSVDPEPQEITATIEARFRATPGALDSR